MVTSYVVMIVGYPGSGKSTLATKLIKKGYVHLNRDTEGGTVRSLLPKMDEAIRAGKNVVLDNLFTTISERVPFIDRAKILGANIGCQWMKTSIEDATYNVCQRMIEKYGHILNPEEIKKSKNPNVFPPAVLFKYRSNFEPPSLREGFDSLKEVPFVRKRSEVYDTKALILDYDDTLRSVVGDTGGRAYPINKSEIRVLPKRAEIVKKFRAEGYVLLGVSNQSGVGKGILTEEKARELFENTNMKLGINVAYSFCPHKIPPISCYCRKPMPGFGVEMIHRYKLDPSRCIMVGDQKTDETFAIRCGFQFQYANEFFK